MNESDENNLNTKNAGIILAVIMALITLFLFWFFKKLPFQ